MSAGSKCRLDQKQKPRAVRGQTLDQAAGDETRKASNKNCFVKRHGFAKGKSKKVKGKS